MSPRGYKRYQNWEAGGHKPLAPLSRCFRDDLPNRQWICGNVDFKVQEAVRQIDRGFEIIYDKFTATGTGPGHHLYRVKKRGGTLGEDYLILEFSIQADATRPWPVGVPIRPEYGHVMRLIRERDKARIGREEEQAKLAEADERDEKNQDADLVEAGEHLAKEMKPMIERHVKHESKPYRTPNQSRVGQENKGFTVVDIPKKTAKAV